MAVGCFKLGRAMTALILLAAIQVETGRCQENVGTFLKNYFDIDVREPLKRYEAFKAAERNPQSLRFRVNDDVVQQDKFAGILLRFGNCQLKSLDFTFSNEDTIFTFLLEGSTQSPVTLEISSFQSGVVKYSLTNFSEDKMNHEITETKSEIAQYNDAPQKAKDILNRGDPPPVMMRSSMDVFIPTKCEIARTLRELTNVETFNVDPSYKTPAELKDFKDFKKRVMVTYTFDKSSVLDVRMEREASKGPRWFSCLKSEDIALHAVVKASSPDMYAQLEIEPV